MLKNFHSFASQQHITHIKLISSAITHTSFFGLREKKKKENEIKKEFPTLFKLTFLPWLFSSRDAITASFSMGFKEHVEYTILPPSASCSTPRVAILNCNLTEHSWSSQLSFRNPIKALLQTHNSPWTKPALGEFYSCQQYTNCSQC